MTNFNYEDVVFELNNLDEIIEYFLQEKVADKTQTVVFGTPVSIGVTNTIIDFMWEKFFYEDVSILCHVNDLYTQRYFIRKWNERFKQVNINNNIKDFSYITKFNTFKWGNNTLSVVCPENQQFFAKEKGIFDFIIFDKDLGESTKKMVELYLKYTDNIFVFTNDFEESIFYNEDINQKILLINPTTQNNNELNIDKKLNDGKFIYD